MAPVSIPYIWDCPKWGVQSGMGVDFGLAREWSLFLLLWAQTINTQCLAIDSLCDIMQILSHFLGQFSHL